MEVVSYEIPVRRGGENAEPVLLMPIGDIQYAGVESSTALGMLQRHIEWGMEHHAWFVGLGDYIDFASPSNRQRLMGAALYDTAQSVLMDKALELTMELYEKALKPSKGRWLGLLEGHHWYMTQQGITSDQRLAEMLKCPFLGTTAIIRMVFKQGTHAGTVRVWAHHGVGYGQTVGAPLNRLERLLISWPNNDIYLIGHHSKKVSAPVDGVDVVWEPARHGQPKQIHRTRIIACTGGFSRGYQLGAEQGGIPRGGYVEQKMLSPVALGGVLIRIKPRWIRVAKDAVNEHVEGDRSRTPKYWLPDLSVEA